MAVAKATELAGTKALQRPILFAPAFTFWFSGFVLWMLSADDPIERWQSIASVLRTLPPVGQATFVVVCIVVVGGTGLFVQELTVLAIRFLEGYWPEHLWQGQKRSMEFFVQQQQDARWKLRTKLMTDPRGLTKQEEADLNELEQHLRSFPANPRDAMATRLGNLLRSAERHPYERYGLDGVFFFSRLWLVLPSDVKEEIGGSRDKLDAGAAISLWGLAFMAWTPYTWAAMPIAASVATIGYWLMLNAAEQYGELIEAAFDLHRWDIYRSMGWRVPTLEEEPAAGIDLAKYLILGTRSVLPTDSTSRGTFHQTVKMGMAAGLGFILGEVVRYRTNRHLRSRSAPVRPRRQYR